MRIFIPDIGRKFELAADASVRLYPMGDGLNYENEMFEQEILYGKYNKGKFKFLYKRSVVKYDHDTMRSEWQKNKFKSFFFVAKNGVIPDNFSQLVDLVNYPAQAMLIPGVDVYVEHATYLNSDGDGYWIMAPRNFGSANIESIDLRKSIYSSIEEVTAMLDTENTMRDNDANKLYEVAIASGSDFSKMIKNSVPTTYVIPKGSSFMIKNIGKKPQHPLDTSKIPFAHLVVNEKNLWVESSELFNFDLKI